MNLRIILCALASGAVMATSPGRADRSYSIEDLQALQARNSVDELLLHLEDVKPAARDKRWDAVAQFACTQPGNRDGDEVSYCIPVLQGILKAEPGNKAFAMKAGKWVRLNAAHWQAVPFFASAITKSDDPACHDQDVSLAVLSGLAMPADTPANIVKQSQQLGFGQCWTALKDAIVDASKEGGGYFQDNTCGPLTQKGLPPRWAKCKKAD